MARGRYDRDSTRADRALLERSALLDAARALLLELPQHQLTVSRVCGRAATGRNTLYLHWAGIEELVSDVAQQAEQALRQALVLSAEQCRTPRTRLAALCDSWLRFLRDSPGLAQVLLATPAGREGMARVLHYEISQVARQAYAAGLCSRLPSDDVLAAIRGAFQAICERAARGHLESQSDLSLALVQLTLGALR